MRLLDLILEWRLLSFRCVEVDSSSCSGFCIRLKLLLYAFQQPSVRQYYRNYEASNSPAAASSASFSSSFSSQFGVSSQNAYQQQRQALSATSQDSRILQHNSRVLNTLMPSTAESVSSEAAFVFRHPPTPSHEEALITRQYQVRDYYQET